MSQRLVGYGEGTALSKAVGELVNSDYFHPVLSEMRHPLFCAAKAACAQNAGFYLQAIASGAPAPSLARTLGVRAAIYRCGNWFRTVAVVPQKDQALDLLSRAQTQSPYNPYLVEMASWCPGKSLVPWGWERLAWVDPNGLVQVVEDLIKNSANCADRPRESSSRSRPCQPKATSLSRSGLRPMEAQTQGQKSHNGITRKSEFLNHFWGTAARLLGPT